MSLLPDTLCRASLALFGVIVLVLKMHILVIDPTSSRRKRLWSWCYSQRTGSKKRILLMPPLHVLGHKHYNYYTKVLQQEALKNKQTKASTMSELQLCLSCLPDSSVRPSEGI